MSKRKWWREAMLLGGICAAALLPLAYIALKKKKVVRLPAPQVAPQVKVRLWEKSRFLPTSFPVGNASVSKDFILLINTSNPATPLIIGRLSDARLVKRLAVPRPAGAESTITVLDDDQKTAWLVWKTKGARPMTHVESWDWRKARRLNHVSFPFNDTDSVLDTDINRFLAVGRAAGTGKPDTFAVFDTRTGKKITSRYLGPMDFSFLRTSDKSERAAVIQDNKVLIFDGHNYDKMHRLKAGASIDGLEWNGLKRLAVSEQSSTAVMSVYDVASGRRVKQYALNKADGSPQSYVANCEQYEWTHNARLCFGLRNNADAQGKSQVSIPVWHHQSKTPIATLKAPGSYNWLEVTWDDKYLLAQGSDAKGFGIRVWNIDELAHPKAKPQAPRKPTREPRTQ